MSGEECSVSVWWSVQCLVRSVQCLVRSCSVSGEDCSVSGEELFSVVRSCSVW